MDERKNGVSDEKRADDLVHDIERLRDHIGQVAGELDRRRHDLFDLKKQLRRHALPLAIVAATIVGVLGGAIALGVARRRRRATVSDRLSQFRLAMRRISANPDRLTRAEPGAGRKIAGAAGAAAASVIARRLASGLFRSGKSEA